MTANFDIWKRVIQEQYPDCSAGTYHAMWQQGASDWGNLQGTELANLFEQYVLIKQLTNPTRNDHGNE